MYHPMLQAKGLPKTIPSMHIHEFLFSSLWWLTNQLTEPFSYLPIYLCPPERGDQTVTPKVEDKTDAIKAWWNKVIMNIPVWK